MTAPHSDFLNKLRLALGPRGFSDDPEVIDPWLSDWRGRFHGRAIGIASPATTEQVSAVVSLCAAAGVPLVPQGGNSGMSGGATPDASGTALVLSLRRMNRIRELDQEGHRVVAEAGVILQTLHEAAEAQGLRFPLTLGGKGSATIGGLVSTNAGGTQVLRHGVMRALISGLEVVLPDGQVLDTLTPLKKDNRGFDLKQLFIGSEGTLGIVTAASLVLLPALAGRKVLWAGLESPAAARRLLLLAQDQTGDVLEGFEVLPDHCLDSVLSHVPGTRAPLVSRTPWYALIELAADKDSIDQLGDQAEALLADALDQGLISDAVVAANEAQAEALWLLRDEIAPAERARGPAAQHDIAVPIERMADFIPAAQEAIAQEFPGVTPVAFGHLGDGNIHFHVLAPAGVDPAAWQAGEAKQISARVHDLVTQWGGTISAEHGIGQLKRDELARLSDPARLGILRAVKHALDPQGILNPGKLI